MSRSDDHEELRQLADAICDGEANPDQVARLDVLLGGSEDARRFYLDYVGMHARLRAENDATEIVMRRLQYEEVVVRKGGSSGDQPPIINLPRITDVDAQSNSRRPWWLLLLVVAGAIAAALLLRGDEKMPKLLSGELVNKAGETSSGLLSHDTYVATTPVRIKHGQQILELDGNSEFSLSAETPFRLRSGSARLAGQGSMTLAAPQFSVEAGNGSQLSVTAETATIEVAGKAATLIPARWRPRHFWSFDEQGDRPSDWAGTAHGVLGNASKRAKGIIGHGAVSFNNKPKSVIDVGSGGGTALATGSFAVEEGVTIEALAIVNWAATKGDYDEIFRKDNDANLRMLLCFQNDLPANGKIAYPKPPGVGPTLAFGLFLVGQGYHELELLLDGFDGRPSIQSLRSGKAHHFVASYDVKSGRKAIYVNGKLAIAHNYPPGTKMLSGGPGSAAIGNSPLRHREPFTGVLDEVAFYDFALPGGMVARHYANVTRGRSYYGPAATTAVLPEAIRIPLQPGTTYTLDKDTGLIAE
jgi:hypothetical protein